MEDTLNPPQRSAIVLTALAYVPAVFCMMTIGVVVPFLEVLARDLHASKAQLGLGIALFSIPAAVLATVGGGLIDEYGVRRSMLCAAIVAALGSLLIAQANSLAAFDGAMLVGGLGFGTMCVASPCLIMLTLSDPTRIRAMSFVSTFAPTGYAAGLLLAVPFTGNEAWRLALLTHAALLLVSFATLFLLLPPSNAGSAGSRESLRNTFARMLSVCREPGVLRLGLAVALPNAVSYGTGLSVPSYLARIHHISIGSSSAGVALAKLLAMILGGLCMGQLLVRTARPFLLFSSMVTLGLLAQWIVFLPASGFTGATAALVVWLFAFGGMAGGAMTLLPVVTRDRARSGATSGIVNQCISLASFAAPSTWLALHDGPQYVMLAAGCLLVAMIALPAPRGRLGLVQ